MKKLFIGLLIAGTLTSACSKDDDDNTTSTLSAEKSAVVNSYSNLVYQSYLLAITDAELLEEAIHQFVDNPSQLTHGAAKQAWLQARETYGETEAFRFGDGPIDDADGPEGLLNAWPLDEGYIDYTTIDANSGIINDTTNYPTISKDLLESLNEEGGETNVSVGYHAVEFLLWGQDLNAGGDYSNAGQRSYTDFVDGSTANADRRRTYLLAAAELIVQHLEEVANEWTPVTGAYRTAFTNSDADVALAKIMTGIGILSKGELAGERIYTAVINQDQEDEHSCFSDNTHRDIVTNATGIYNVFFCKLDNVGYSGSSLYELIKSQDPAQAEALKTLIEESVNQAENMDIPFDEALTVESSRQKLLDLVTTLQKQGDEIVKAGAVLGLTISADLPG